MAQWQWQIKSYEVASCGPVLRVGGHQPAEFPFGQLLDTIFISISFTKRLQMKGFYLSRGDWWSHHYRFAFFSALHAVTRFQHISTGEEKCGYYIHLVSLEYTRMGKEHIGRDS